jgi:hypothetical protein
MRGIIISLIFKNSRFLSAKQQSEIAISILEDGLKNFPDHPLAFILMGKQMSYLMKLKLLNSFRKSSELLNTNKHIYYKRI